MGRSLLETARAARGLTQAAAARRAGTSQPTLSAYERGTKSPTLAVAERILNTLGYDLTLQPRVTFEEITDDEGRRYLIPDQLWRLDPGACFTPFLVETSTGSEFHLVLDRTERRAAYLWLIRHGTETELINHLDAGLLVEAWPDLAPNLPPSVRAAWGDLVRRTVFQAALLRRGKEVDERPRPISAAALRRLMERLHAHGLAETEVRGLAFRRGESGRA